MPRLVGMLVLSASLVTTAAHLPAAAMAQEKVLFPSVDADLTGGAPTTLTGFLFRPSAGGASPAIVGLHGCDGLYREGNIKDHYASWADILKTAGYTVLLVDSFGSRGHGNLCAIRGERPVRADRETPRDAYGALRYLQSRPDVKADRIGIIGWSNGGVALLWTLTEISAARPKPLPSGDFRAAVAFYPACQSVLRAGPWSSKIPLLVLMGEIDNFTPPKPCIELLERARKAGAPVEIHLYPGSYHVFDAPNEPLRVATNVRLPDGTSPTIGTNAETRLQAIQRVNEYLTQILRK